MTVTPEILSMSLKQIVEEETELFESIGEPNLPLLLDSGAAATIHFKLWRPYQQKKPRQQWNLDCRGEPQILGHNVCGTRVLKRDTREST